VADRPTHLAVGHVNRPHGTKGEVYVWPLTDHPEGVFAPGVVVHLAAENSPVPDPSLEPFVIETVRSFQRGYLVLFEGVLDRNDAETLRGHDVLVPIDAVPALEEGELFYHEWIGVEVVTVDGERLGVVQEIYELLPADLLEVRGPRGTLLIPLKREIVKELDREARRLVVDPPPGLLDL
jgi:16S rRNA processing protein RimM